MPKQLTIKCSDEQYLNLESAACGDRGRTLALVGLSPEDATTEIARREALTAAMVLRLAVDFAGTHAVRMADQAISDEAQAKREQYALLVAAQKEEALASSEVLVEAVDA